MGLKGGPPPDISWGKREATLLRGFFPLMIEMIVGCRGWRTTFKLWLLEELVRLHYKQKTTGTEMASSLGPSLMKGRGSVTP
jgi:hypothetical protein